MKNVLKKSAKSLLFLLVLTAVAVAHAAVHKKLFGSGMTWLITAN